MKEPAALNSNPLSKRYRQWRVLIVDDHAIVRAGLKAVLLDSPQLMVVGEADTAEEALRVCDELKPEVVLLDLRLPDRSGIEVCRELKLRLPTIKVVFLTSYGDEANVSAGLAAGSDGYLLKTITGGDVADALLKVVAGGAVLDPLITRQLIGRLTSLCRPQTVLTHLTEKEQAILNGVLRGLLNKEIAAEMNLGEKTVRNQLTQIYEKLGVKTRSEAALLVEGLQRKS